MRRYLILMVILAVAAACTGDDAATTTVTTTAPPPATTSTTTTTSTTPTTSTTTTTVAPPPGGTWHQAPPAIVVSPQQFYGAGSQVMASVTEWDGGLAAVGSLGARTSAAVWLSDDGVTWERIPSDKCFVGQGNQEMWSATSFEGGLVVVGQFNSTFAADGEVWTSGDGFNWDWLHDSDALGGRGEQIMWTVTVWEGGLAAGGTDHSGDDHDAAIWTSADGITWERVPHDDYIFGGVFYQGILSMTAWEHGVIAVGIDQIAGDEDAVIWTSVDGTTWDWVPHDEDVFGGREDQGMTSVATWDRGLVAAGYDTEGGDSDAAVWTSADAVTWQRVPHEEDIFGGDGDQRITSVAAWVGGLVAVGYDTSGGDRDAAVWISADGANWERVDHDEEVFGGAGDQEMSSVTAWDGGIVAVGHRSAGPETRAAFWYWTPD